MPSYPRPPPPPPPLAGGASRPPPPQRQTNPPPPRHPQQQSMDPSSHHSTYVLETYSRHSSHVVDHLRSNHEPMKLPNDHSSRIRPAGQVTYNGGAAHRGSYGQRPLPPQQQPPLARGADPRYRTQASSPVPPPPPPPAYEDQLQQQYGTTQQYAPQPRRSQPQSTMPPPPPPFGSSEHGQQRPLPPQHAPHSQLQANNYALQYAAQQQQQQQPQHYGYPQSTNMQHQPSPRRSSSVPIAIPRTPASPRKKLPSRLSGFSSHGGAPMSPYPPGGGGGPMSPSPAYPQSPATRARPKIDPSQIPRPKLFTSPQDGRVPTFYPKAAITQGERVQMPPLADTRYIVQDDGNASPDVMRATTYTFPQTRGTWHQTGELPLAVLCSPLARHSEEFCARPRVLPNGRIEDWKDNQRVPLVEKNQLQGPPPRCGHCQAYANPFFSRSGTCNLCGSTTRGLSDSLTSLPMQFGTVDYEVDGPYITRERPVQPIQLYAIDITCPSLEEYFPLLGLLGADMANHFWRQPEKSLTPRIGVCIVSSAGVAFHRHDDAEGRYTFMCDVTEEPFAPWPIEEWTFDLSAKEGLDAWVDFVSDRLPVDVRRLKDRVKGKNSYGLDGLELSCGGAALAFLADALKESGGRGAWITWRRPNFGVGRLSHRDERLSSTVHGHEDFTPYTPVQILSTFKSTQDQEAAVFYKNLGTQCSKDGVTLDVLFHTSALMGQAFLDIATMSELCRASCGRVMWVTAPSWQEPFREELTRHLQSFSGYDAVFKLRCSAGLQVKSFVSSTGVVQEEGLVGSLELELASVAPTTTIAVEFEHRVGGIPKSSPFVFLQSALLYSTISGNRRVRVSTLAVRISSLAKDVFRSADFPAVTSFLLRRSAERVRKVPSDKEMESPRAKARDDLYQQVIKILAAYRKDCVAVYEQLLLPDTLHLLPLFCMSLMKSSLLRPGVPTRLGGSETVTLRPSSDERAFFNWHAAQANPMNAVLLVYPRIFCVDYLHDGFGEWQDAEGPEVNGFVLLPPIIQPSMEALEDECMYLVDSGLKVYLYVGREVAEEVKQMALGQRLVDWNPAADNLLWQLRAYSSTGRGCESELRPTHASLVAVCQQPGRQAPLEPAVLDLMVEDAAGGEDYVDFLIQLHRSVRSQVQSTS